MNTERLVEANLYISQKRYDERKGMFQKRIESIISYVKETDECRSRMLIDYFGQPAENDCGICDVCLKNKNLGGGKTRRTEVQQHILKLLDAAGGELKLAAIETAAADQSSFYLSVLREMIDDGTVSHSGDTIKKM